MDTEHRAKVREKMLAGCWGISLLRAARVSMKKSFIKFLGGMYDEKIYENVSQKDIYPYNSYLCILIKMHQSKDP